MINASLAFKDNAYTAISGKKAVFTSVKAPQASASYLAMADPVTLVTDANGIITASLVPNTYSVDLGTTPDTSFYLNVQPTASSVISASVLNGSPQKVVFNLCDDLKLPFAKKVTITPTSNYVSTYDGATIFTLAATSSIPDATGSFTVAKLNPGIYQVDALGKATTTFFVSVPTGSNSNSPDGSWNAKDLLVVKPSKGISVRLNNADNSYVLTVSASDARYAPISATFSSGTQLTTGSHYPISASWADSASVAKIANTASAWALAPYDANSNNVTFIPEGVNLSGLNASTLSVTGDVNIGGTLSTSGINDNTGISVAGDVTAQHFIGVASSALTASYVAASNIVGTVLSSSYAFTASYAKNGGTSLVTGSTYPITASSAGTASAAVTASYATSASYAKVADTANLLKGTTYNAGADLLTFNQQDVSFQILGATDIEASTGNFAQGISTTGLSDNGGITSSIGVTAPQFIGTASFAQNADIANQWKLAQYDQPSNILSIIPASVILNGLNVDSVTVTYDATVNGSLNTNGIFDSQTISVAGPVTAQEFVGNLTGTASIASNANTASLALAASTASYARTAGSLTGSVSSSNVLATQLTASSVNISNGYLKIDPTNGIVSSVGIQANGGLVVGGPYPGTANISNGGAATFANVTTPTASIKLLSATGSLYGTASCAPNYVLKSGDTVSGVLEIGSGASVHYQNSSNGLQFQGGTYADFSLSVPNNDILQLQSRTGTIYFSGSNIISASLNGTADTASTVTSPFMDLNTSWIKDDFYFGWNNTDGAFGDVGWRTNPQVGGSGDILGGGGMAYNFPNHPGIFALNTSASASSSIAIAQDYDSSGAAGNIVFNSTFPVTSRFVFRLLNTGSNVRAAAGFSNYNNWQYVNKGGGIYAYFDGAVNPYFQFVFRLSSGGPEYVLTSSIAADTNFHVLTITMDTPTVGQFGYSLDNEPFKYMPKNSGSFTVGSPFFMIGTGAAQSASMWIDYWDLKRTGFNRFAAA